MNNANFITLAKTAALVATTLGFAACSPKGVSTRLDTKAMLASSGTPGIVSEKLALAGEQLLTAGNFPYASEVFDNAIEKDPKNHRAQLYKKILGPILQMKGMAVRIRPLLTAEQRKQIDAQLANAPDSGLKTFVTDGNEDIKSEKDVQAFIDDVIQAIDGAREYLKATKDQEITLNVPEVFQSTQLEKAMEDCRAKKVAEGVYDLENCDLSASFQFKMNRADKEAMQQQLAGMQIYLSILNAYSADDLIKLQQVPEETRAQDGYVKEFLLTHKNWGVLRNPRLLTSILEMGNDAVKGIRWIQANQDKLCPTGQPVPGTRKGYVNDSGLCIENTTKSAQALALVERALNGQVFPVDLGDTGEKINVRPSAVLANPIKDLKAQIAFRTYNCQNGAVTQPIVGVYDKTVGGLFPNGDVERTYTNPCVGSQK